MRGGHCSPQEVYLTESVYEVIFKSPFPHKSVNSSFIITNMNNQLTDLCGNWLLPNNVMNTLRERRSWWWCTSHEGPWRSANPFQHLFSTSVAIQKRCCIRMYRLCVPGRGLGQENPITPIPKPKTPKIKIKIPNPKLKTKNPKPKTRLDSHLQYKNLYSTEHPGTGAPNPQTLNNHSRPQPWTVTQNCKP